MQLSSAFVAATGLPTKAGGVYLLPLGLLWGSAADDAVQSGFAKPLAGAAAFTAVGTIWRDGGGAARIKVVAVSELPEYLTPLLEPLTAPRGPWAGVTLDDRPRIMGIVNATPDSFSDGGDTHMPHHAISAALAMVAEGADIIDVGGESTRPGATPVSVDEEAARVLPVISALAERGLTVSVDTRHVDVMVRALNAGATIVNDIAALQAPGALEAVARTDAAVCLMHMQGEPGTMQDDPRYDCAPLDIYDFLAARVAAAEQAGIARARITVDAGIGFGKSVEHNAQMLAAQALLHGLGCGVLMGASRKRFIAELSAGETPKQRMPGSLSAVLSGLDRGVQIVRVHDVAETAQAVRVWSAVRQVG